MPQQIWFKFCNTHNMKKIFTLTLLFTILIGEINAQSFTLVPRIIQTGAFATGGIIETKSTFTNTSIDVNDTVFNWQAISLNKPTSWDLSICDPLNCYAGINTNDVYTFTLGIGRSTVIKLDYATANNPGNANTKIVFKSAKNQNKDTLIVDVKGWATATKEIAKSKELSFYPNPAKDNIVLKYGFKEPIQIDIYNVLGLRVKSVVHSSNESNIDISDLQNGVYFLRFKDDGRTISKSFTKAE